MTTPPAPAFELTRLPPDEASGLDGCFELRLAGRVYADVTPQLRALLEEGLARGLRRLVVDARALEQIDSSGLNEFVQLLKRTRPQGGKVAFYGLNENVARVFEITKLSRVMPVTDGRPAALAGVAS